MKLRFTFRDFILLLGIMVAMIIAVATMFYRDKLVSVKPSVTKKIQAINRPAAKVYEVYCTLLGSN